ncbi:MAG: PD-(D/E)XK nuclease family protein, partial [Planctomycetia bacterium]|nr:PD-(D/E)XK nuclease family protein [Planctomycetia bacterium]
TRRELSPDQEPTETGPTVPDEWAIYGQYRAVLKAMGAEDLEGLANWAARVLETSPPPGLKKPGTVTVLEPDDDSAAVRRAFGFFEARAKGVRVVLGYDPDPGLAEVFSAVAPFRERLLGRGYEESVPAPGLFRPAALRDAERDLFRTGVPSGRGIANPDGLKLLGAPQGEGVGLVVAREVRHLLDRGADPEDVLVLVRNWDEDAEAVLGVFRSWGLPVSPLGRPRGLASEPAVSALRMALRLQHEGWEASELVKLLRHGRFRPDWPSARVPDATARAAAAVRDSGVFRGTLRILRALDRAAGATAEGTPRARAERSSDLARRVIDEVESVDRPSDWHGHVEGLKRLAGALGIGDEGDPALERFWNALDDQAAVFDETGAGRPVLFGEFLEAESAEEPARVGRAFAREMAKFLRVIGSAGESLTLAYPTRDEKGQEVLPAGFLDDLKRRLEPDTLGALLKGHEFNRFDPAMIDHDDLARSPSDARVRAVALACVRHRPGELARLATDTRHRRALEGTAAALTLTAQRLDARGFSAYDGRLTDPGGALAARFGPDAVFSPSQLESFLLCPFQFFLKYVLRLRPVDDRDELDEDFIGRGNRIHKALEDYEQLRLGQDDGRLVVDDFLTSTLMGASLSDDSEANSGLGEIERRRVEQRRIDRVDLIDTDQGPSFRVIDYKTGAPPAKKDVTNFLMVQLPLYALAVERLNLAGDSAGPRDVGYWDLREKGYSKIDLKDWPETKARLEAEVVGAVARLRVGLFVVDPKKDDCTRYCEFSTVCRIGQVRGVDKGSGRDTP